MAYNINLANKQNFSYKLEDLIPCFIGFNKRVNRISKIIEANPSLDEDFVNYLDSREGYTKAGLFLMYHFHTSGAAVLGIGIGIIYGIKSLI